MLLYKVFFCFSDWFIEISKKLIKNRNLPHNQVFPLFFVQSLLKLMIACLNPCFSITERLDFTRNKLQVSLNRTRGCVRRTSCPQLQQMLELTPGRLFTILSWVGTFFLRGLLIRCSNVCHKITLYLFPVNTYRDTNINPDG